MTRELAHAASMDAGNRACKAAGRKAWNEDDANAAAREYDRLYPVEREIEESRNSCLANPQSSL